MITNEQLRAAFVDEAMLHYFRCKLAPLDGHEVSERVEETLKFLFISSECAGAIPVSKELDEVWHFWILQTQEYMELCEALPAGAFIHHSSNDYLRYFDPSVGQNDSPEQDVKMLALYFRNFGPFEEGRTKYWLFASHLMRRLGWTVGELNDWLDSSIPRPSHAVRRISKRRPAMEVAIA